MRRLFMWLILQLQVIIVIKSDSPFYGTAVDIKHIYYLHLIIVISEITWCMIYTF